VKFPMKFMTCAAAKAGVDKTWITETTAPIVRNLPVGIPPEFGGPGQGYSPEDLIGFAAINCYVATFQVYAQNSKLAFECIRVGAVTTIEQSTQKLPEITRIEFEVEVFCTDEDRARRLMEKVSKNCIVLNALKVEKVFSFKVLSAAPAV
jgi:organic hydroperoxide reductase OsmC/OhrA